MNVRLEALRRLFHVPTEIESVPADSFPDPSEKLMYSLLEECYQRYREVTPALVASTLSSRIVEADQKPTVIMEMLNGFGREAPPLTDSALRALNDEYLRRLWIQELETKRDLLVSGRLHVRDISVDVEARSFSEHKPLSDTIGDDDEDRRVFTGLSEVDQNRYFEKGSITTVSGDTGSMKTAWTLFMAFKILKHNKDMKIVYFEKEMPLTEIKERVLCMLTQTPNTEIADKHREAKDKISRWKTFGTDYEKELYDAVERFYPVGGEDFDTTSDMARIMKSVGAHGFFLDYLTLMAGSSSINQDLIQVCGALKRMVVNNGYMGVLLSQCRKLNLSQRLNKIPYKDDMEYSGIVQQLSANVLMTFYPCLYYSSFPQDFYYIVPRKLRHGSIEPVPFRASPSHSMFYPERNNGEIGMKIRQYLQVTQKVEA